MIKAQTVQGKDRSHRTRLTVLNHFSLALSKKKKGHRKWKLVQIAKHNLKEQKKTVRTKAKKAEA